MLKYIEAKEQCKDEDELEYMMRVKGSGFRVKKDMCFSAGHKTGTNILIPAGTYVYVDCYYRDDNYKSPHCGYSLNLYLLDENRKLTKAYLKEDDIPHSQLTSYFEQDAQTIAFSDAAKERKKEIRECARADYHKHHPKLIGAFVGIVALTAVIVGVLNGLRKESVLTGVSLGAVAGICATLVMMFVIFLVFKLLSHNSLTVTEDNVNVWDNTMIFYDYLWDNNVGDGVEMEEKLVELFIEKHLQSLESLGTTNIPVETEIKQLAQPKPEQNPMGIWVKHDKSELELYKTI